MSTVRCFTGPEWLAAQLEGLPRDNYVVVIERDIYDRPVIGTGVAVNGIWDMQAAFTNPETNETKPLIEWLEEIDYEPKEIEEIE